MNINPWDLLVLTEVYALCSYANATWIYSSTSHREIKTSMLHKSAKNSFGFCCLELLLFQFHRRSNYSLRYLDIYKNCLCRRQNNIQRIISHSCFACKSTNKLLHIILHLPIHAQVSRIWHPRRGWRGNRHYWRSSLDHQEWCCWNICIVFGWKWKEKVSYECDRMW